MCSTMSHDGWIEIMHNFSHPVPADLSKIEMVLSEMQGETKQDAVSVLSNVSFSSNSSEITNLALIMLLISQKCWVTNSKRFKFVANMLWKVGICINFPFTVLQSGQGGLHDMIFCPRPPRRHFQSLILNPQNIKNAKYSSKNYNKVGPILKRADLTGN